MCGFPIRKATGYGQAYLVCASKLQISMCGFPIHEAGGEVARGPRFRQTARNAGGRSGATVAS